MEPINITNNVTVTCTNISERARARHERKATKIAHKIINARESGKKRLVCKAYKYNKKLLKLILLDLLPDIGFRIITKLPGILKIVL